jgi:hypothetical protein
VQQIADLQGDRPISFQLQCIGAHASVLGEVVREMPSPVVACRINRYIDHVWPWLGSVGCIDSAAVHPGFPDPNPGR